MGDLNERLISRLSSDRDLFLLILGLAVLVATWVADAIALSDVRRGLSKPVEPGVLAAEIARLAGRERRKVAHA